MVFENIKNSKIARYLIPTQYVSSIHEIDIDHLVAAGIKGLIVDLDDTLLTRTEFKVPLSAYNWIQKVKDKNIKICLASNGSRIARLNYIAQTLNIPGSALAFKPFPPAFNKALKILGTKAKETCVVGDQILTDIIGGNILGMHTILVKPISEERSLIRAPYRYIENFLVDFLDIKTRT